MQAARDHIADTVGDDAWVKAGVVLSRQLDTLVDRAREPLFRDRHVVGIEAPDLGRFDHFAAMDVGQPRIGTSGVGLPFGRGELPSQ